MARVKKTPYIDNVALMAAMKIYKVQTDAWKAIRAEKQLEAHQAGLLMEDVKLAPKPRVSEYVGECILLIAQRLSHLGKFSNYPHKEEMIGDGIVNCLQYIDNFDPNHEKSHPFNYFTKIIWYAFIRRITLEKTELATKYKSIMNTLMYDEQALITKYGDDYCHNEMLTFIDNFDGTKARKEERRRVAKNSSKIELASDFLDEFINYNVVDVGIVSDNNLLDTINLKIEEGMNYEN